MSSVVIAGDTSGTVTLSAPAVAGTTTLTLPTTTDTLVGKTTTDTLTNKTLTSPAIDGTPTGVGVLTSGTSVSASGTSVDFTSIPSWVKRITVMFSGVSTSGTSIVQVQLGDSGGIETSGYSTSAWSASINYLTTNATGIPVDATGNAATVRAAVIPIVNVTGNIWVSSFVSASQGVSANCLSGGTKTLSATLDRIRITTVNGTNTFDAGTINILYE
jgi:hypothetical protein